MRGFGAVFAAVVLAFGLTMSAFLVNRARPSSEASQPDAAPVRASGKCAASAITACSIACGARVRNERACAEEREAWSATQPAAGQEHDEGYAVCHLQAPDGCQPLRGRHEPINQEFLRKAATPRFRGPRSTEKRVCRLSRSVSPNNTIRAMPSVRRIHSPRSKELSAMTSGCEQCHSVGKPNADGSIGNCTACHTRHTSSVAVAREPRTCGQCHMGPDHSQIEIYEESKHCLRSTRNDSPGNLE